MEPQIAVSLNSAVPIYQQITDQLREQIHSGQIKAGSALPSLRALARNVGCSLITTTRAYSELVNEGILINLPGRGYLVAEIKPEEITARAWKQITYHLQESLTIARGARISTSQICKKLGELDQKQNPKTKTGE